MKPQNPAAAQSGLINDVVAPAQAVLAAAPLAEPPKEATFVEAPVESSAVAQAPTTPVAELAKALPSLEAKSTSAVVKTIPAKQKSATTAAQPTFAIALAVTLFVTLAAVALYAYSKTA